MENGLKGTGHYWLWLMLACIKKTHVSMHKNLLSEQWRAVGKTLWENGSLLMKYVDFQPVGSSWLKYSKISGAAWTSDVTLTSRIVNNAAIKSCCTQLHLTLHHFTRSSRDSQLHPTLGLQVYTKTQHLSLSLQIRTGGQSRAYPIMVLAKDKDMGPV